MRISFFYVTSVQLLEENKWFSVKEGKYVAGVAIPFLVAHAIDQQGSTIAVCYSGLN